MTKFGTKEGGWMVLFGDINMYKFSELRVSEVLMEGEGEIPFKNSEHQIPTSMHSFIFGDDSP